MSMQNQRRFRFPRRCRYHGRMPPKTPSPIDCAAWYREAERSFAGGSYPRAHQWCRQILEHDPNYADAFFLLALIAAAHENYSKAADVLGRAIRLDGGIARYHAHLGRCWIALNRHNEARAAARRATALTPDDALTLDTIGVVFSRTGDYADAVPLFERAVAIDAHRASYHYNLGAARQFSGDFAGAQQAYCRAIELDPQLYRAHSSLAQLTRATPAANRVAELEALFARLPDDADAKLHIGHALAKQFEDLGDHPAAFDWLERATHGKRAQIAYDGAQDAALFAAAAATTAITATRGHPSAAPIFIVGMPRTGTTLVDRILSSHPDVTSVGESTEFALIVKRLAGTPSNKVLDAPTLRASSALDWVEVGTRYLEASRSRAGTTARFIDKMPLNFFYAALIHAAFPNARIICLRRNPMDACLSNLRQLFSTRYPYYDYAYDLLDTGRYYLRFDALIATWRAHLPAERFLEVSYEALVANQEAQSRALLDFCALPWHDACLAFHTNAAPVATASSVQVRSPLYSTSVGRWQRYGARLDPLRALFDTAGVAY
jgi:tetratricopeptide (TPR) repeat protein